jgi:hypothetical protein
MKRALTYVIAALALAGILWYLLVVRPFHGVANADHIRILEAKTALNGKVAMLVERSDDSALSSADIFVFLADHQYTVPQLRRNLYALDPVFHVGDDRLTMEWVNGNELDIRCLACTVTQQTVTTQRNLQSGVTIRYVDFP